MKSTRMFVVGLFVGVMLTISASAFAAGGISKIEAYLRDGFTFMVDGQAATLQNTPIVYKDTSYLPVRELAGMLGYDVGFEDNTIKLDAKTPPAELAATEQVKDVDDVTESNASEWLLLSDPAETRDIYEILYISKANGDTVIRKGNLEFTIPNHDRSSDGEFVREYGDYSFRVKYNGGYMYFNKDDLKTAGFID